MLEWEKHVIFLSFFCLIFKMATNFLDIMLIIYFISRHTGYCFWCRDTVKKVLRLRDTVNEESLGAESYRLPLVTHYIWLVHLKALVIWVSRDKLMSFPFLWYHWSYHFFWTACFQKNIYDSGFYFTNNAARFCWNEVIFRTVSLAE